MTLNGMNVVGYNIANPTTAEITLQTSSLEDAIACVTDEMVFHDGAGVTAFKLFNFGKVASVEFIPDSNIYKLRLIQKTATEANVSALQIENVQLSSKLEAAIQSNQTLEECIVEIASVVYA